VAAVTKIKPLLTPDQLTVLEDPQNQWQESHPAMKRMIRRRIEP